MLKTPGQTELVTRAQAGDRTAFAALLEAHYDFLYRTAYRWCGSREDAEDIAQEVAVKLAGALKGFDHRSAFTSWLYRIVLNAVRDRQRQGARAVRKAEALMVAGGEAMAPTQEAGMIAAELWDAVRALPTKQRDAVMLVYGEDLSHKAAAEIMGTRESTVSWYVHEAKKTLKAML